MHAPWYMKDEGFVTFIQNLSLKKFHSKWRHSHTICSVQKTMESLILAKVRLLLPKRLEESGSFIEKISIRKIKKSSRVPPQIRAFVNKLHARMHAVIFFFWSPCMPLFFFFWSSCRPLFFFLLTSMHAVVNMERKIYFPSYIFPFEVHAYMYAAIQWDLSFSM